MRTMFLLRDSFPSYYAYRKAIKEYRDMGWIVANVVGGVIFFESFDDYNTWKNQK